MATFVLVHGAWHGGGAGTGWPPVLGVVDTANVLFRSEMVGAVRGTDPRTGHSYDDTRRYVDASSLDDDARAAVFEGNVRRVHPRLGAALRRAGR